uniref:RNase H type-1 domain-containing protein n=1 Tax=Fagus sylvatica TaxID=28930 RepID=A0A2N9EX34_FAGSY
MLQQPDSLVSRVYKAKYYPRGDFMEAGAGNRPSYALRSILSARSVLKMGMQWHIGDGNSVRITEDSWLPFSFSNTPLSVRNIVDKNERVSILINAVTHSWDVDIVQDLFSPWEARVITSIPLPPCSKPDRLFWSESKLGCFFVKSACYMQLKCHVEDKEGEYSLLGWDRKFWKFLWSLSLPPKIKDVGSVTHALWLCTTANDVWLESKLPCIGSQSLLDDYKKVSKRFGGVEDIGIQAQSVESMALGGFSVEDMWIEEVEVLRHKFKSFSAISKEINVVALALARCGQSHMMPKI